MFLFAKKNTEKVFLVCHVGSGYVSAQIVLSDTQTKKPKAVWYSKEKIFNKDYVGTEISVTGLRRALRKVIVDANTYFHNKAKRPDDVSITFAAPWYLSENHSQVIKNEKPKIFTQVDLVAILQEAGNSLEKKSKEKKSLVPHLFNDGVQIIEKILLDVKLNGYDVEDPFGKMAHELYLSYFMSVIPKKIGDYTESLVSEFFPNSLITLHSFPMTHLSVMEKIGKDTKNSIFVDVSDFTTDISKDAGGEITANAHISIGKQSFIKAISDALNVEAYIAESLLSLYVSGNSSERESADMHFILKDIELLWSTEIEKAITGMTTNEKINFRYVLSCDSFANEYFKKLLPTEVTSPSDNSKNNVSTIDFYQEMISYSQGVTADSFLAIESLFCIYF